MSDQFDPIPQETEVIYSVEEPAQETVAGGVNFEPTSATPWGTIAPEDLGSSVFAPASGAAVSNNNNTGIIIAVACGIVALLSLCCCSSIFALTILGVINDSGYGQPTNYYYGGSGPDYGIDDYGLDEFYYGEGFGSF